MRKLCLLFAVLFLSCSDYERDNPNDYVNKIWRTFSDADENGGSSTIKVTDKDGSLTVSGELVMGKEIDPVFAGWGTRDGKTIDNLKEATYISFGIKGGDETHRYKVQLIQSDIKDYNYYYTTFITAKNMKNVTLCIDDFKQADWGDKKTLDMSKVVGIEFLGQTGYKEGTSNNVPFEAIMNGLEFGTGKCTPTTELPQQSDQVTAGGWKYSANANYNADAVGIRISTINMTSNAGAYTITGNMGDDAVGFHAVPINPETLRDAKYVTFKVKGDGRKYLFQMSEPNALYGKTFIANSTEQTVTICFSKDLAVWWGSSGKSMDMSKINLDMGWDIDDTNKGAFNFTVSDISVGYDNCPSSSGSVLACSGEFSEPLSYPSNASINGDEFISSFQQSFDVTCDGVSIDDGVSLMAIKFTDDGLGFELIDLESPVAGEYDIWVSSDSCGLPADCSASITVTD